MDNELILQQFTEIEQKVERLIEALKAVEAKNRELNNQVNYLNEELQGKVKAEQHYHEERDLVRSKIDTLLVRLEEITETD